MNSAPPTFEDLSIDDNLPELERLVRYSQSSIGLQRQVLSFSVKIYEISKFVCFRLVHVKMLAEVSSSVG